MEIRKIGEFVELNQGLAINKKTQYLLSNEKKGEFTLPLLRIADMMSNTYSKFVSKNVNKKVVANENDIIYTRTGQVGLAFSGYNGVVHNNSFIVTLVNEQLDKNYLYTILQTDFFKKQALSLASASSVQPDLTHDMFKSIKVPFLEKSQQQLIAKVYMAFSDKITNNSKINDELEAMAKTLYDYWFLQFEFPNKEGKPYKSSGGRMVYNEQLKRKIPEGWESCQLNDIICENKKSNIKINQAQKLTGDIPFFTSGEEILYVDKALIDGNNIFMSTGGNSVVNFSSDKCSYSTDTWSFNARDYTIYLYQFLKIINKQIDDYYFSGSGLEHLQKDVFGQIKLLKPNIEIINKFNKVVQKLYNEITLKNKENYELIKFRNFLLPLLMNGQVTFKDLNGEQTDKIIALSYIERFNQWKQSQGYAARGDVDDEVLKKIFDAMDKNEQK